MEVRTIRRANDIVAVIDGVPYPADKSHPRYFEILECLRTGKHNKLIELFDLTSNITNTLKRVKDKSLHVEHGVVYWNGFPLQEEGLDYICGQIIQFEKEKWSSKPLMKFLGKLLKNNNPKSIASAYPFLQKYCIPITEDGDFIGYKKVKDDYMDYHTGKFCNRVGRVLKTKVYDTDDILECSNGFHIGSLEYARDLFHPGQGRMMLCKVNPMDIVCVPSDNSWQKCRVKKYKVVGELKENELGTGLIQVKTMKKKNRPKPTSKVSRHTIRKANKKLQKQQKGKK